MKLNYWLEEYEIYRDVWVGLLKSPYHLDFKPGQFVKLTYKKYGISRFYSIASSPTAYGTLQFVIRLVGGEFTSKLLNAEKGDSFEVEGPYGKMFYNDEKKLVMFAGGVGIAPMMSIVRYINEKRIHGNFYLFYSERYSDSIPFLDELLSNEYVNVTITLTREEKNGFLHGRINEEMVRRKVDNLKDYVVFICGSRNFAIEMKKIAENLDVSPENIKVEAW